VIEKRSTAGWFRKARRGEEARPASSWVGCLVLLGAAWCCLVLPGAAC